jgi:hypothetical protein
MDSLGRIFDSLNDALMTLLGTTVLQPAAIIPSLGIALLVYLLVTRQLEMIQDDDESAGDDLETAGEKNEWLGGPTSEWLGV